jgi:hypothetical protein
MIWKKTVMTHVKVFFQHLQRNMEEKLKKYFSQNSQEVNIPTQNKKS